MAPPPAATAVATRRHAAAASHASPPRELAVAQKLPRPGAPRSGSSRLAAGAAFEGAAPLRVGEGSSPSLSVSMVVAALLAVVVGQALLANGQVNLSSLQQELTLEQSAHSQAELAVAQLETPPRIVAAATRQGLVAQGSGGPNLIELPYVSLSVPLPTPKVTPAPAPPPPTTSPAGAGAPSGASTGSTSSTSRRPPRQPRRRRRRERRDPTRA